MRNRKTRRKTDKKIDCHLVETVDGDGADLKVVERSLYLQVDHTHTHTGQTNYIVLAC